MHELRQQTQGRLTSGFFHTSAASPRRLRYDNRRPSTAH
nr:MAG TPA: hypothetical protein [Caudoviricetes sp.]